MNYAPYLKVLMAAVCLSTFACKEDKKTTAGPTAAAPTDKKSAYAVTSIEGFVVRSTVLTEQITATGTLLPNEETQLHPEASGRVTYINLPEGRAVRKGTVLLRVFDEDLKTQLRRLETQLKQADITEKRLAELLAVKGVSQQEYDLAALQVQNLRSEMDLVRINLAKTEMRAPYDGVLGLRSISPGAYVTPATIVTTIRSGGGLKLDFSVPEKYSALIKPGLAVQFTVEGQPENKYTAIVQATEQRVSADSRSLQVRAAVRGATARLLPGAFAEVNLALGANLKALMIPNQAIVPQARDKKVFISENGKAKMITVKTGVRQSDKIEIVSGLSPGDTVAVTGILFLKPDAPLQFSKVE